MALRIDKIAEEIKALERAQAIREARKDVLPFAKLMRPHPKDPGNVAMSRYVTSPLHIALAQAALKVESGQVKRLIINVPPRHGKTELMSKIYPAWFVGRDPYRSVISATYNQSIAEDYGKAVRGYMLSQAYAQVFPNCELKKGSQASDRLETEQGGQLSFVGHDGTITGRGGDLLIVDDPLKGSEEASSPTIRNKMWKWFNTDLMSRFMTDEGVILLIQTRWHDDDIVGRITDPTNPHYIEEEAALWSIINIPALAEDDDPLGRPIGQPLWPERFGEAFLLSAQRRDPVSFSALYQQRPTPADGFFFKKEYVREYGPRDLPPREELNFYITVDLAVGQKQVNDKSVILVSAVDAKDNIYLVDCAWKRMDTLEAVDTLIKFIKRYKPGYVWGEKDHIFKSIGPFLYKRMREERIFTTTIDEIPSHTDKTKKAQPVKARMQMGNIYFPRSVGWYGDAMQEMMKFPNGRHDDFVDALANLGRALNDMLRGAGPPDDPDEYKGPKSNTYAAMKADTARREGVARRIANMADM